MVGFMLDFFGRSEEIRGAPNPGTVRGGVESPASRCRRRHFPMRCSPCLAAIMTPCLGLALTLSTTAGKNPRAAGVPSPPARAAGPDYPHKSFHKQSFGTGGRSYWLFEPAEPKPERAPVVVFCHGWLA